MAPRCGLAHVVVNGEDLGIYSHVESIRKLFFKRYFEKPAGDLYEGYFGDFTDEPRRGFDAIIHKWGPDEDRVELRKLHNLLQKPGLLSLAELEKFVDLNGFITGWAAEVLIGHPDSYSGNHNNWYAYRNRASGRFYFIPWGADAVFRDPGPYFSWPVPKSVKARGYLCQRLWELPAVRERYRKEMQRLLDRVWNETALVAELERISATHARDSKVDQEVVRERVAVIRTFIEKRRAEVQAELDAPAPDWPEAPKAAGRSEKPKEMIVTGAFSTTMGSARPNQSSATSILDAFGADPNDVLGKGNASITYQIDGNIHAPFTKLGAVAMADRGGYRRGYPVIQIAGADDSRQLLWSVRLTLDPHQVRPGKNRLPIDLFSVQANFSQGSTGALDEQSRWLVFGQLELEEFSMEPGAAVKGTFTLNTTPFDAKK